jgi:predicted helicase
MKNGNFALLCCRQQSSFDFQHIFITKLISDLNSISLQTKEQSYVFPLYQYQDGAETNSLYQNNGRIPNLNMEIIDRISKCLELRFINEKNYSTILASEIKSLFTPLDVLDYIYAVLHSPMYRSKYKEFLKIDFPRVPYPKNAETFWKLVKLGGELRQIHLLESPLVKKFITTYPVNGSNEVTKLKYEDGKVWINVDQYFDHVPKVAWEFYIGGYQSAQKWLKDRKGRVLSFEDIQHYQKIIVALAETDRLMKEIDMIEIA